MVPYLVSLEFLRKLRKICFLICKSGQGTACVFLWTCKANDFYLFIPLDDDLSRV